MQANNKLASAAVLVLALAAVGALIYLSLWIGSHLGGY